MGGFMDPFIPSPAWPQDIVFSGSSWAGSASSFASSSVQGMEFHPRHGSSSILMNGRAMKGQAALPTVELHEQLLHQQSDDLTHGLDFAVDGAAEMTAGTLGSILSTPCPVSLTDSAPVICSSNESSGSEQSGGLPHFLMGGQSAAWHSAYANMPSMAGDEASQSFGFGRVSGDDLLHETACTPNGKKMYQQLGTLPSAQLQLHDDAEFNNGKLLSFSPGQQVTPINNNLLTNQQEFSGLHHLNLSSLVPGPLASFNATGPAHNPKQFTEVNSGKNGTTGNGIDGSGAPKPRQRARRGQATDPHSIAERLRREKISDRMKNLQQLVPNSNKTDKASMLEEIIEYIKFLQLQTKVLSMSRLGSTDAVLPLLTESQTESSGLLLSPRSGERQAAAGKEEALGQPELLDEGTTFEQEVVQLMDNNMTAAMQYLQNKGLCLMPIALASAISTQKGTAAAAIRTETGAAAGNGFAGDKEDVKRVLDSLKPLLGSRNEMRSRG